MSIFRKIVGALFILIAGVAMAEDAQAPWLKDAGTNAEAELVRRHGESVRGRAARGIGQVSRLWRAEDGDRKAFEEFVVANFAADQAALDTMFNRYEYLVEQLFGHMQEITREFRQQVDLDLGPIQPYDELFAGYDPSAHVIDDFFKNKIAFTVLLNFPLTTLEQRLAQGDGWTRRQWAEARLAQMFSKRVPAEVNLAIAAAAAEADRYISEYNIWMHHLIDDQGSALVPARNAAAVALEPARRNQGRLRRPQDGPAKQRMIQQVMERIVTQTIPAAVIDNPDVDWNPVRERSAARRRQGRRGRARRRDRKRVRPRRRGQAVRKTPRTRSWRRGRPTRTRPQPPR